MTWLLQLPWRVAVPVQRKLERDLRWLQCRHLLVLCRNGKRRDQAVCSPFLCLEQNKNRQKSDYFLHSGACYYIIKYISCACLCLTEVFYI